MNIDDWKSQIKRGTLEFCILLMIKQRPSYGYEIISTLEKYPILAAKENTIYPLLRRLMKEDYVSSSWQESVEGLPPRKYYSITDKGLEYISAMSKEWNNLLNAINEIKDDYKVGVMDVDIETSLDAQKVADLTGVPSIQIHNGGLCHIDAEMTTRAVDEFGVDDFDLLFLENIGNLVCPAEFDTGAHKNMMILSVPEGDDKPLKYPLMFSVCDLVIISKIDTLDYFDFDIDQAKVNILNLNPNAKIICLSAKTGEGMNEFIQWIKENKNN